MKYNKELYELLMDVYFTLFLVLKICCCYYSYNEIQQDGPLLNFILNTTLHVSERLTVHHQEFCYCIHNNWYLSYWNFKMSKFTSVYIYIYIYIYIYVCVCVCVCVYIVVKF